MSSLNLEQLRDELGAAMEVVVNDVRQKWRELNQGPGVLDSLRAFAAAVDWTVRGVGGSVPCAKLQAGRLRCGQRRAGWQPPSVAYKGGTCREFFGAGGCGQHVLQFGI